MVNIEYVRNSSIFNSECEVLINPVNCVGVMGAGLALQFKQRFPDMFLEYCKRCESGRLSVGGTPVAVKDSGIIIVLFPTKDHWKQSSNLDLIEQSLHRMMSAMNRDSTFHDLRIACPKLGCGYGGLRWEDVRPKVEYYLGKINCKGCEIYV